MGRRAKTGLDYFPKDVTFYDDFKIMDDDFQIFFIRCEQLCIVNALIKWICFLSIVTVPHE